MSSLVRGRSVPNIFNKGKISRAGYEEMSALYDELYEKADQILKDHNPCNIIDGRCLNGNPCCRGCEFLSREKGCKEKSLVCKLWLCAAARLRFPKCAERLDELYMVAAKNPCLPLEYRSIKKDFFAYYEIAD